MGLLEKIFTGNPWVFTIKEMERAFQLKFSHPIL
jgi:hypothetical protein